MVFWEVPATDSRAMGWRSSEASPAKKSESAKASVCMVRAAGCPGPWLMKWDLGSLQPLARLHPQRVRGGSLE